MGLVLEAEVVEELGGFARVIVVNEKGMVRG
jgi:hypothetical protein